MIRVIGVRFRTAGKIYYFAPGKLNVKRNDHVIVETARGIEYGTVVGEPKEEQDDKVVQPLKSVLRIATPKDDEQEAANKLKEKEAFKICLEKIRKHNLQMKLIDAEYTFDNNKVLFYFTADGRIDFRELVKDLASVFKTRIELRQIGVRDETKILGGIGICGRPLCCHTHLSEFAPVSIKMAKEQNLSLNPTKISGVCGRLMCCLKNEEETYEELNRRLPNIGDYVTLEGGLKGEVQSVNVLRQLVKVIVDAGDEKEIKEYPVERLHFRRKHTKKEKMELTKEELQELERLEEEEWLKEQEDKAKTEGEARQGGKNRHRQDAVQKPGGQKNEEGRRQGRKAAETRGEADRRSQRGAEIARGQNTNAEESAFADSTSNRRQGANGGTQRQAETAEPSAWQNEEAQGQHGEGRRQSRARHNGNQKQPGQRQDRNEPQGDMAEGLAEDGRQDGRNRRDNRRRQENRGRRNGQQESGASQVGRNRRDNRGRRDTKASQEG